MVETTVTKSNGNLVNCDDGSDGDRDDHVGNQNSNGSGSNSDHYNPSVRLVCVPKLSDGSCGFHLSRSKWDPYPWVSRVDIESPAYLTGVKNGDCVLEVNGEDVLGMRITEVANLVRSKTDQVNLLLWTTGMSPSCNPDSLCCGPMPLNLERLSASVQTILVALECPVCLDTIPPPTIQCQNGHLVCAKCSMRSEKCPVCREKYSQARSLIAEQIYNSITESFKMNANDGKLREKLFGVKCKKIHRHVVDSENDNGSTGKPVKTHTHSFLAKIMGKSTSAENLNSKKEYQLNNGMMKTKPFSLSTSEIFNRDTMLETQSPPPTTRLSNSELCKNLMLKGNSSFIGTRRPRSCNVSTEHLHDHAEAGIQIAVPQFYEKTYQCPCDNQCTTKYKTTQLSQHVMEFHKTPIVTFGTASAEIALPPRTPIENACVILTRDRKNFWLKLHSTWDSAGDLFVTALMEGSSTETGDYILEILISNFDEKNKILKRELILRNEIYDMEEKSWEDLLKNRKCVHFSRENLESTFNFESEVTLKARVLKLDDIFNQ